MTSQDITQAGGFVAEAMSLVDTLIASVNEAHHSGIEDWRDACFQAADRTYEDIRAHLESHASQQAAVVAGLVGAAEAVIREALDDVDVHPCDHNNDDARARGLYGTKRALYDALHAMKEQP